MGLGTLNSFWGTKSLQVPKKPQNIQIYATQRFLHTYDTYKPPPPPPQGSVLAIFKMAMVGKSVRVGFWWCGATAVLYTRVRGGGDGRGNSKQA